jgi:hypothetical protein
MPIAITTTFELQRTAPPFIDKATVDSGTTTALTFSCRCHPDGTDRNAALKHEDKYASVSVDPQCPTRNERKPPERVEDRHAPADKYLSELNTRTDRSLSSVNCRFPQFVGRTCTANEECFEFSAKPIDCTASSL